MATTKYFTYRGVDFTVTAAGAGSILVDAMWPRSIYLAYRRPITWTSSNTMAFDYCTESDIPKGSYYRNMKAAQREFYTEYKERLSQI